MEKKNNIICILILTIYNTLWMLCMYKNPANTRRYLDVNSTSFERCRCQMDVKTTLCVYWEGQVWDQFLWPFLTKYNQILVQLSPITTRAEEVKPANSSTIVRWLQHCPNAPLPLVFLASRRRQPHVSYVQVDLTKV